MNKNLLHIASQFGEKEKKKRQRKRVFSLLSIAVVFFTLNALMLPAITMEKQAICGNVEHTHNDECYSVVSTPEYFGLSGVHQHSDQCYSEDVLTCGITPTVVHIHNELCYDSLNNQTCPFVEIRAHTHSEECFNTEKNLICTTSEDYHIHSDDCYNTYSSKLICNLEDENHIHSDACYQILTDELTCQLEVSELHKHSDGCWLAYPSELICTEEETDGHSHTDSCYNTTETLICTTVETDGHTHTADCFTEPETVLVCETAETVGHLHGDSCYITKETLSCNTEETAGHTHTAECFTEPETVLVCETAETAGHQHGDSCYITKETLSCNTEETAGHTHTAECYTQSSELACQQDELQPHIHDDSCYQQQQQQICTQAEVPAHTHSAECYTQSSELVCQQEEQPSHTHIDSCYQQQQQLICTQAEIPAHAHTQDCYKTESSLECTLEEIPAHHHSEECYSTMQILGCEKEEKPDGHIHTEQCYEETRTNICGREEVILHTHSEACYDETSALICDKPEITEHNHSEECTTVIYTEQPVLICKIEEHRHTDECYPPETDDGRELVCIREEHVHTESCDENCEIQEHLHTEDCYIAADIEKEDVITEDTPPLDIDLYDISNGPVFIVTAKERIVAETEMPEIIPRMKFSARTTFAETVSEENIEELTDYLKDHNGALRLLLETADGTEVPKENGNYVVNTTDIYTLKVNIDIPDGILPGRYRYKLPDGITLDGGAGSLTALVDNRYVVLGEWEINENNGYIVLNFFEEANNYTHVIISAYMAISFSADKEAIDFDGLIKVDIIPPPHVKQPTEVEKGPVSSTTDEIKWRVTIKGNKDSNIPGNILIDGIVTDNHSYTDKDMKNGITISVSQPDENGNIVEYHYWKVYPGDSNLVWNSKEWHYTIPEICVDCKKPLGNENWIYCVEYTSTPQTTEINGILHYQNMVSVDGSSDYGDAYFNQHTHRAVIMKNGEFVSSGEEGGYNWDVIVTIPGIEPGKKADYGWFIQDEMKIVNGWDWENGIYINNGITKPTVTAFYKGEEITVQPYTKDVRDEPFVYSIGYPGTGDINPKVPEIYFLCKCNCNENNCLLWGSECGIDKDYNPSYCRCWTEEEDVTFTFSYRTTEKDKESLFSDWGGQDYYIQNVARLANFDPIAWAAYPHITDDNDRLFIPGIFKKILHKNFDGYTANYIITVNEAKLNLTNGAPLKIHDAMTDTLAYVNGSLFITAEDINGKETTLTEGLDYSVIYDGSGNHVAANGDKKHVLDITIYNPQAVKYTLDYDATLIFQDDDTDKVLYSNSAIIELWGDDITSGTDEVTFTKIDMSAQAYSVKIVKSSASTNELLQGARFGLYNQHGGLIAAKSTDEIGEILFKTNVTDRIVLSEHELYYIQEIAAPEGYVLDDTKHWFCFCKCEGECEFKPEVGFTFDRVPQSQMVYNIQNYTAGYELPRTGGGGTQYYTAGGLVLIGGATVLLLYRSKKCRKEDYTSP